MKRLALLVSLLAGTAAAQEPPPPPPPVPAPAPGVRRAAHLKALRETVVHFDFRRAPVGDVLAALEKATGVPCAVGKQGKKALARRKFRMKYVADRRAEQVLTDVAKAAALDVVVTDEGALLDTPREVRKLRKKLKLPGEPLRLTGEDVERMLETKQLSLAARERPLEQVLRFLREETGVRFVLAHEEAREAGVTLNASATPLARLLDRVLEPLGLGWVRQGSVILVDEAAEIARQREEQEGEAE